MTKPKCEHCGNAFHTWMEGLCDQAIDAIWEGVDVDTDELDKTGVPFSATADEADMRDDKTTTRRLKIEVSEMAGERLTQYMRIARVRADVTTEIGVSATNSLYSVVEALENAARGKS